MSQEQVVLTIVVAFALWTLAGRDTPAPGGFASGALLEAAAELARQETQAGYANVAGRLVPLGNDAQ